ncbi:archaellin/type IV pilin N-terminal domain-containing protein, partial [Halorubrum sp. JWXQ-INN 858]|uniref:archaellin/type IV pilin N-terminal domain-containing protein n=1 Tax=Halorubrum sp. JWXQ-INN 858 TaxID=2690782 RepID=UPI002AA2A201
MDIWKRPFITEGREPSTNQTGIGRQTGGRHRVESTPFPRPAGESTMQLSKLFNDDKAVSPVIGVILMVAITV